jgi:hypothetical protein
MHRAHPLLYLIAIASLALSAGCLNDSVSLSASALASASDLLESELHDRDASSVNSHATDSLDNAEANEGDLIDLDTLPSPERKDPFQPVSRADLDETKPVAAAAPVRLCGFIDLGKPAALLSINGRVVPLAEGASHEGIQVLAVDPPRVTLRRGLRSWTVSLTDQATRTNGDSTASN